MVGVPDEVHQLALELVREEFDAALVIRGLNLKRVNRALPPAERYRSIDEMVSSQLRSAMAISTFAVRVGLLTQEEVREIVVNFYAAHPELRSL